MSTDTDWTTAIADATRLRRHADRVARLAEENWLYAIRSAVAAGTRVVPVAEAAGVTRYRIYQITRPG